MADNKKKYTINEMYDEIEEQDIINYCKRLIETFKAPNFSNLKNIEEDSDVWGEVFVTNSREEVVSFIEYGYDFLFE